jgi:hypothetical protein
VYIHLNCKIISLLIDFHPSHLHPYFPFIVHSEDLVHPPLLGRLGTFSFDHQPLVALLDSLSLLQVDPIAAEEPQLLQCLVFVSFCFGLLCF